MKESLLHIRSVDLCFMFCGNICGSDGDYLCRDFRVKLIRSCKESLLHRRRGNLCLMFCGNICCSDGDYVCRDFRVKLLRS